MKTRKYLSLMIGIVLLLSAMPAWAAVQDVTIDMGQEIKNNISWAQYYAKRGNMTTANQFYVEARRVAIQTNDVAGLAFMAYVYLYYGIEADALDLFSRAGQLSARWANDSSNPQNRPYGKAGLRLIINYWNKTFSRMPATQTTRDALRAWAEYASNMVKLIDNEGDDGRQQTAGTTTGIYARAERNSLFNQLGYGNRMPHGLGDAPQGSGPISLIFDTGDGRGSYQRAVLTIKMKPYSQCYVYFPGYTADYNSLPLGVWSTIQIDLSAKADIMKSIRAGRLEVVVGHDEAVEFAYLQLYN